MPNLLSTEMVGTKMFLVITRSPLDDEWDERDAQIILMAGRKSDFNTATNGRDAKYREHIWELSSLNSARELKRRLEKIPHVVATVREK